MFEKFTFSLAQIKKYYQAAVKDFKILKNQDSPDLIFYLCYQVIIKTAMAVCAKNGLRVKAHAGHHKELVFKLSELLGDPKIETVADKIRIKRNRDLYDGGMPTSLKEADFYVQFCNDLMKKADNYLFQNKLI